MTRRYMSPREIDDAVNHILRDRIPGQPIENPKFLESSRVIREMAARGAPSHVIAGELNVRSLERIERARQLLGVPSGSVTSAADRYREHRADADADLMQLEGGDDDPPEAA